MKWFKHDSASHNDEKVRELIHEIGVEGYGIYMICLELIAEKIDKNLSPEIEITWKVLSEKCRTRYDKLQRMFKTIAYQSLIVSEFRKDKVKLSCPNLLKRLDNWTHHYEVTTKQLSANQNQKKNQNKKENKNKPQVSFTEDQKQILKQDLATKNKHAVDSQANQKALEDLTGGVLKDKKVENIMGVAKWRIANAK